MNVSIRQKQGTEASDSVPPSSLNITKLGIVSRDYRYRFENGLRDFSHILPNVLKLLDDKGCDAILFSLFSIPDRNSYDPLTAVKGLKNVKAIFLEEFEDEVKGKMNSKGKAIERERGEYNVYYRLSKKWNRHYFNQIFGTLEGTSKSEINDFVNEEMPERRIMGNCCVLLCGESNGVKYSKENKIVEDTFGLLSSIPKETKIILNPIHDRMTRFEMPLKRQFLSKNKRWVISVWNKGKKNKKGNIRDGEKPAWMIFFNGKEVVVDPIENDHGVEVGILELDIRKYKLEKCQKPSEGNDAAYIPIKR